MRTEIAASITQAFEKAIEIVSDWTSADDPRPYCWFRGINDATLTLAPGAYWRTRYNEHETMVEFCREAPAFVPIGSLDSWEAYYLAQHHGIPTRLLDWSDSFASALFFALDRWDGVKEPCIWILRPYAVNEISLKWQGVLCPENHRNDTAGWLPTGVKTPTIRTSADNFSYNNEWPLAIIPTLSNKRLISQKGTFTVHGIDKSPIEEFIKIHPTPDEVLAKIVLQACSRESCKNHLHMLGIRRSTIYPDIDNFVLDLKESGGW